MTRQKNPGIKLQLNSCIQLRRAMGHWWSILITALNPLQTDILKDRTEYLDIQFIWRYNFLRWHQQVVCFWSFEPTVIGYPKLSLQTIRTYSLKWGQVPSVMRRDATEALGKMFHVEVPNCRPPGRPRKTWMKWVKEDLPVLGVEEEALDLRQLEEDHWTSNLIKKERKVMYNQRRWQWLCFDI